MNGLFRVCVCVLFFFAYAYRHNWHHQIVCHTHIIYVNFFPFLSNDHTFEMIFLRAHSRQVIHCDVNAMVVELRWS